MLIQNLDLKTAIKDAISANSIDGLPSQLLDKVSAVIDVNPAHNRIADVATNIIKTSSGNASSFTVPAGKVFMLTNVTFAMIKDVVCDVASGALRFQSTVGGKLIDIITIPVITTTAQSMVVSECYATPVKCDPGAILTLGNDTFTAGTMTRSVNIKGYYVDRF